MRISGSAITRDHILDIINNTNEMLLSQQYDEDITQDIIRAAQLILNTDDDKIICHKIAFLFVLLLEQLDADNNYNERELHSLVTELKLRIRRFIAFDIKPNYLTVYNDAIQEDASRRRLVPSYEGEFKIPSKGEFGTVQRRKPEDATRYKVVEYIIDSECYIYDETVRYEEIGLESAYRKPNGETMRETDGVI